MKLATRIGGEYRLGSIRRRHWQDLAIAADLDSERVVDPVSDTCERVASVLCDVCAGVRDEGLAYEIFDRIEAEVTAQLDVRRRALDG
ncbi:MAG: hypothetical protein R3195_17545 [Gemmatimonadota bacterium]|nr:hypothetical protein [Gemmatimonadota bacterium]